jgi:CheY-like chemotaxis protein
VEEAIKSGIEGRRETIMKQHHRLQFGLLAAAVLVGSNAFGQDNPPAAAAPPAANPRPASRAPNETLSAPLLGKRDVVVETIVGSNPQTPREMLDAAALLSVLDQADLAKGYLQKILAARLDENALADLAAQIEPDALLRMATNASMQPEGRQVADAVLAAAAKRARNPQYLQHAIEELTDPSRAKQREGMIAILAAREDAVPAIVQALSNEKFARIRSTLRELLVKIGQPAIPPMVASLQSDNSALNVQIINVLEQLGFRQAVPFLAAPATATSSPESVREAARSALLEIQNITEASPESAAKLLKTHVERYLNHVQFMRPDIDGSVEIWHWDSAANVPVREKLPPEAAAAAMAARLAADLMLVARNDPEAKRLFLVSTLEAQVYRRGLDTPLARGNEAFDAAARLGPAAVEDALSWAIATGHTVAAQGSAEVLGAIGDLSLLQGTGAPPRPLILALSSRDRRLRFAAAEAIMKLGPKSGFAGSGDLLSTLAFIAGSSGTKKALVAFPNEAVATQLASILEAIGYDAVIATNGRNAYLDAINSSDFELALLSGRIDRPPVWVLLQQFRHDPRTGKLPIGLMAEEGDRNLERLESYVYDPLTMAFQRPMTPDGMKFFVDRLIRQSGIDVVPFEVCQQQAAAALKWLKQLNEVSPRDFELQPYEAMITKAFHAPKLSPAAAELLATIRTHSAQRSLAELANRSTEPLANRQAAAAAFSTAVRMHGIGLTIPEIQHQYDRYNQSETEDPTSQQLLGLILDAIELPTASTRTPPSKAPAPRS